MSEVCEGVGRLGWVKVAGAVGSSAVVVANIFREYCLRVALVGDQHAVSGFCSEGADEPFRKAVRSRAPRKNPDSPGGFRICWVVPWPSGLVVVPRRCTDRLGTARRKNTEIRGKVIVQSPGKKSHASMVEAWVRRNCHQVVSRSGAGGYPPLLQEVAGRGCSEAVAERKQLAPDPRVSPAGIFPGYALDRRGHCVIDGRVADVVWRSPFLGDQAVMPVQDRAWCDSAMSPQHRGEGADKRGEDCVICPLQAQLR